MYTDFKPELGEIVCYEVISNKIPLRYNVERYSEELKGIFVYPLDHLYSLDRLDDSSKQTFFECVYMTNNKTHPILGYRLYRQEEIDVDEHLVKTGRSWRQ